MVEPRHGSSTSASSAAIVRLTMVLHAASARAAQDLLDALRFLAARTRLEPSCRACWAWTISNVVYYIEEWATEADMRRRVRSDEFSSLLGLLEASSDARVQFDFVASTRGLEYVAEVRASIDMQADTRRDSQS